MANHNGIAVSIARELIRLSIKAIDDTRESREVQEYAKRTEDAPAGRFGSLADKLRDAIRGD